MGNVAPSVGGLNEDVAANAGCSYATRRGGVAVPPGPPRVVARRLAGLGPIFCPDWAAQVPRPSTTDRAVHVFVAVRGT